MKTRFFALAALALALVACNNDNENLNGDPVAAQFTANIGALQAGLESRRPGLRGAGGADRLHPLCQRRGGALRPAGARGM